MPNNEKYAGPERRAQLVLDEKQLSDIVERVYRKAADHIYLEIGKAAARAALYLIGAGLLGLAAWLGFDTSKWVGK